jgi:hypothetical protein
MSRNDNARKRNAAAIAVRENREAEERANRASPVVTGEVVLHDETIKPAPTTTDVKTTTKVREYRYPLSMPTGGIKFPGSITFTAYEIKGLDISGKIGGLFSSLARNVYRKDGDETTADKETDPKVIEQQKKDLAQVSTALQTYENLSGGVKQGSVILPLQRDLRFSDNVSYETANLGVLGGGLETALGGKNPFAGATKGDGSFMTAATAIAAQAVAKRSGTILGAIAGDRFGKSALGGAVLGSGATEALGDAVKSATRIASTPNQRTLFKEVSLRQFAFTFKMIATSAAEADQIKNIVKFFRQELYPEKITLGENKVPIGYKFPNVFQIDVKNQFGRDAAHKIQRCYLRDVQTSYNATGNGLLTDGNFIEVDISLSFQEVSALDKNKVRDEFY